MVVQVCPGVKCERGECEEWRVTTSEKKHL